MEALKIQSINFEPDEDSDNNHVKADTEIKIIFRFNRAIGLGETIKVRIILNDPTFHLERSFDETMTVAALPISSSRPPSIFDDERETPVEHIGFITMKFPEELAGGEFGIKFYIMPDIKSLNSPTPVPYSDLCRKTFIEIVSGKANPAPRVEKVCIAENDNIKYGSDSNAKTPPVYRDEPIYLHIFTCGLYGKLLDITRFFMDSAGRDIGRLNSTIKVKNNICCFDRNLAGGRDNIKKIRFEVKVNGAANSTAKNTEIPVDLTQINPNAIPAPTTSTASPYARIEPILISRAVCRVEFRPDNNYDGRFGFSWYRKGELGRFNDIYKQENPRLYSRIEENVTVNQKSNDHPFDTIMGRHYDSAATDSPRTNGRVIANGNDSSTHFDTDKQMADNHKSDYRRLSMHKYSDPCYIPVMTLRKGQTAVLRLFHHTKEEPGSIYFAFNNSEAVTENYFDYKVVKLPYTPANGETAQTATSEPTKVRILEGSNLPENNRLEPTEYGIALECLKEFSKEISLDVYSTPKRHIPKLEMRNGRVVATPDKPENFIIPQKCGSVRILPNDITVQRNIKVVFFNLETNHDDSIPKKARNEAELKGIESDNLNMFLGQAYVKAKIDVKELNLVDAATKTTESNYMDLLSPDGSGLKTDNATLNNLKTYLEEKVPADLKDDYKIFFCGDKCGSIAGFSSGEKFTVCFPVSNPFLEDSLAVHELLHSLGLPHTFDGSTSRSKYVYKDGHTDNIMDYSHHLRIDRASLFEWQWRALNVKI